MCDFCPSNVRCSRFWPDAINVGAGRQESVRSARVSGRTSSWLSRQFQGREPHDLPQPLESRLAVVFTPPPGSIRVKSRHASTAGVDGDPVQRQSSGQSSSAAVCRLAGWTAAIGDSWSSAGAVVQGALCDTDVFGGTACRSLADGDCDLHPWDEAHRVARSAQYSIYVEPDLLQEALPAPGVAAQQGFDQNWPPAAFVSPGWRLANGFTGFEQVRGNATGNGVRIAHLDTGYWPPHDSTPRHIRRDLGYNFYENNTNTTDPGTSGVLRNP